MLKIDWDSLMTKDKFGVVEFARGELSGRGLYDYHVNTPTGGIVRNLLRSGVNRARVLARKAAYRRGISV